MKNRIYIRLAITCFVLCIGIFVYGLSLIGLFSKNKFLVKALACNCADYEVIAGSVKLSAQLPDSLVKNVDVSAIFVDGFRNPYQSDYTRTYDYYIITGKVAGLKQASSDEIENPVVNVSGWENLNITRLALLGLLILVLLFLSFSFRKTFIAANRPGILQLSLLEHGMEEEEIKDFEIDNVQ